MMRDSRTFKFTDSFGAEGICKTKVTVEEKISNNSKVYVINYVHHINNVLVDSVNSIIKPCPFGYYPKHIRDSYDGVIVIKNDMTANMVRLLMMDDEELEEQSGTSSAADYRSRIMVNITHFWD